MGILADQPEPPEPDNLLLSVFDETIGNLKNSSPNNPAPLPIPAIRRTIYSASLSNFPTSYALLPISEKSRTRHDSQGPDREWLGARAEKPLGLATAEGPLRVNAAARSPGAHERSHDLSDDRAASGRRQPMGT
jgi:hypothetical protein